MNPTRLLMTLMPLLTVLTSGCGSKQEPVQGADLTVLARNSAAYAQAEPGQKLVFPRDHGPHPDYRIEWWYLTANLSDPQGARYGAQWTLFRLAVHPPGTPAPQYPWQNNQVFMAHFAITTPDRHVAYQRYARGSEYGDRSRAGVSIEPFAAWLDDWSLHSTGVDWLPLQVQASQDEIALSLLLESNAAPILQGDEGFSQKHPDGGGSYYYSQPFLQASGELTVEGQPVAVHGNAWLDREWSSQFLQGSQTGWDWFSLHLDTGEKLMLFRLRQKPGGDGSETFLQGSLIAADGTSTALDPGRIRLEELERIIVAERALPLRWSIKLPQVDREIEIRPLRTDQWMDVDFPYWEGAIIVDGDGPQSSGLGYMELTGYAISSP